MSKKGFSEVVGWTLGILVLVLVAGIFIRYWLPGLELSTDELLRGELPQETVDIKQEYTEINPRLEKSYLDLFEKLRKTNKNCFIDYDLIIGNNKIIVSKVSDGMLVQVITEDGLSLINTNIPGKVPCVVEAQGFYNKYFNEGSSSNSKTFREVDNIIIEGFDFIIDDIEFGKRTVEKLYYPDESHVCFIPTKRGNLWCDADGLLDDDCFEVELNKRGENK